MNCPLCGETCRCLPKSFSTAPAQQMSDGETHPVSSSSLGEESSDRSPFEHSGASTTEGGSSPEIEISDTPGEDPHAWRGELAARLDRYRSRRKPRPPRYPSLRLRFEEPPRCAQPAYETASNQALALEGLTDAQSFPLPAEIEARPLFSASAPALPVALARPVPPLSAKVIEFPRFNTAPLVSPDELAEPVMDRPRILEAPEVEQPAPALGGITMEAVPPTEVEKRPGIDIPLQSAPLVRRMVATAIDGLIIAAASALFGYIFRKVAGCRPPIFQIFGLAAAIPFLLWATYQYLLIVYSASTPGLRVAGLELARFDGTPTNRRLRRWRVLASYLSAISLGMGYAWLFLDEDALCWHDRITHTYLAPKPKEREAIVGSSAP